MVVLSSGRHTLLPGNWVVVSLEGWRGRYWEGGRGFYKGGWSELMVGGLIVLLIVVVF